MRVRGINYDTGFSSGRTTTHEPFQSDGVRFDMRVIREDLHCTAVRITGGDPDRLEVAATHAANAGLDVWFCPFTNDLTQDALLTLIVDCAGRAERLRSAGATVVFLTGSEISICTRGFLPGDTLPERAAILADPLRLRPLLPDLRTRVNAFLRQAVTEVRAHFAGPVSYASVTLDGVDWTPFDIIATDAAYRTTHTAPRYRESIRAFVAQGHAAGKPVAATEFGCASFTGAGNGGGTGFDLVEWSADGRALRPKGAFERNEEEQAAHLCEVLDVFDAEGVDAAFLYTFARFDLPVRLDDAGDLDRVSAGIVKVLDAQSGPIDLGSRRYPDARWEPKAAFDALAAWYGGERSSA
jgi:hypothetical protein